jgi:hypothetical protein
MVVATIGAASIAESASATSPVLTTSCLPEDYAHHRRSAQHGMGSAESDTRPRAMEEMTTAPHKWRGERRGLRQCPNSVLRLAITGKHAVDE